MYLTKSVLLLVVIFQLAVFSTAADTCTYTKTLTQTFTPTKASLDVIAANSLYNNFEVTYYESFSSDIEVSAQLCSSDKAEFDAFTLAFTNDADGAKLKLDKVVATAAPTTTPAATTPATVKPTEAPAKTAPANAGSSLKPANFLYTLLAISAIFMPKNRLSVGIVLVCAVLLFSGSTTADATANTKITLRVGVPPSVTKFCKAGASCMDRSINGPITNYVNILGKRYADLAQGAKCDMTKSLTVPTGWKIISSKSDADMLAVQLNNWNTYLVVDADGIGWKNQEYKAEGQANTLAINDDGSVRLTYCEAIVLITQDFDFYETGKTIVGAPRITPANTITFHGYDYAAADNTAFADATSNACQTVSVYLQDGWIVAPDEDATHIVRHNTIGIQSFGTKCMALANGNSYTQDLDVCSTTALASTSYNGNKIVSISTATCNANYTRIMLRRQSSAKDSWTSPATIDEKNTHAFNGTKFAMIDNADPAAAYTAAGYERCQSHFMSLPYGYRVATGAELSGFINVEAWKVWNYFCFAGNGGSTDHNKAPCTSIITKTVGSVNYYQTRSCGHVAIVQDISKQADFVIGMKVLLLSTYATVAQNNDSALELAFTMLNATGAAYDHVHLIDSARGRVFADKLDFLLDADNNPKYYAIVVTDSQFSYKTVSGDSQAALTAAQKAQLSTYKYMFNVRLVSLSGYPSDPALGLTIASSGVAPSETHFRLDADFITANAATTLKGLKTDRSWNVTGTYCLFVTPTANIVPVVRYTTSEDEMPTASSQVGAAVIKLVDGTEELHFFVANSATTVHGPLLSNMWLEWVTKGIWVGSRRVYLSPQIDDLFMDTEQFDKPDWAARLTGDDLRKTKKFLNDRTELPMPENSFVTLEFGFNAGMVIRNAEDSTIVEDELYDSVREMRLDFHWESHTWTHLDLTYPDSDPTNLATTRKDADDQLGLNIQFTKDYLFHENGLDEPKFSKNCMITPKITGLFNPNALDSMVAHGITCAVGDNSRPELIPENKYHPIITSKAIHGTDGVWIIPRSATEIYFDSALPSTEVNQFNTRYGDNGSIMKIRNFTMHEIIDQEASRTVNALMFFRHDPYMFHQCNVIHFNFTYYKDTVEKEWSLVTLWLRAVVDLYNEYMTVPILNIKHDELLVAYKNRLDRDNCGIDGQFKVVGGKITAATLTTAGSCEVGITGSVSCPAGSVCREETYGPDHTAWVTMNGGSATMDASVQWS